MVPQTQGQVRASRDGFSRSYSKQGGLLIDRLETAPASDQGEVGADEIGFLGCAKTVF